MSLSFKARNNEPHSRNQPANDARTEVVDYKLRGEAMENLGFIYTEGANVADFRLVPMTARNIPQKMGRGGQKEGKPSCRSEV
jgi:hypothetical protein